MKILNVNKESTKIIIKETIKVLKNQGLVIFPSDTVYGALVDAKNEKAVKKLIDFKNRPPGKPISVFVKDFSMINHLVYVNEKQRQILKEILPGSFTVILPSKNKVSSLLESEKKTLGIRLVDYHLINELLKKYNNPITATSANLGGKSPHYSIESLLNQLPDYKKQMIDLIVDAGKLPRNKPSTIIDLSQSKIKILRQGDLYFLKNQQVFITENTDETKKLAEKIIKDNYQLIFKKPLIFILEGDLGVGKTIFVKGLANFFNIKNIVSPSFVIYYEYQGNLNNEKINFYHFDLYNIEDKNEFKYLKINQLLKEKNLLIFEWGEKSQSFFNQLAKKGLIFYLKLEYLSENKRKITLKF